MSEKENNRENNQKKFDLQEHLIDYAAIFWLLKPSLVTNTNFSLSADEYSKKQK